MILAIESSLKNGSISILENSIELGNHIFNNNEPLSQSLVSSISCLLKKLGIERSSIKLVAVSNGPGSLTGIRVGIAVGMGFSYALGVNCIGISLLEAMRLTTANKQIISILPAGKKQSYFQYLHQNRLITEQIDNELLYKNIKVNPQITIVIENSLSGIFNEINFENEIVICQENLAELIGRQVNNLTNLEGAANPLPLYIQKNQFNKLIIK